MTNTGTVYECRDCGEQTLERRCPDCNLFTRRIGPGGHCPHCDEITLITDLQTNINTGTYTENLTGSGGAVQRHRLSSKGNRQLNSALHTMAITQMVHPGPGQDYYRRKLAEGKTRGEARRALKRDLANVIYATLVADQQRAAGSPGGHVGAAVQSSAADPTPTASTSEKSLPGLAQNPTPAVA